MSPDARRIHTVMELRSIVSPIAEKYGVDKVYLFGSVARGDYGENSDYDFCIGRGKIHSLVTLSGFYRELRGAIGHEIDIVTMGALEPEFLNKIMAEGIELYAQ